MNRDHHEPSELDDFESRLRSLAPRPPIAAAALVEVPDDLKQVADGQRWWSVDTPDSFAFYRTAGLSAVLGALVGAACTMLILSWSEVPSQQVAPPVAVATDEMSPSNVSPSNAAAVTEHNQNSTTTSDSGSNLVRVEPQSQITSVRRNMNEDFPGDWLDELRRLQPGTLGVGTRLMNQQSARLRSAKQGSTFESEELSADGASESLAGRPSGVSHIDLDSPPLPQRQWMRQMLTSPNEFY